MFLTLKILMEAGYYYEKENFIIDIGVDNGWCACWVRQL
jgi:hypothetical protein